MSMRIEGNRRNTGREATTKTWSKIESNPSEAGIGAGQSSIDPGFVLCLGSLPNTTTTTHSHGMRWGGRGTPGYRFAISDKNIKQKGGSCPATSVGFAKTPTERDTPGSYDSTLWRILGTREYRRQNDLPRVRSAACYFLGVHTPSKVRGAEDAVIKPCSPHVTHSPPPPSPTDVSLGQLPIHDTGKQI